MADSYNRLEQLPPNYLAQFFAGVPGQNVPGIMPLLNQELVNRVSGFGVEGANPYTYRGNRIAGFSPTQQNAFNLTNEGVGSYSPYMDQAGQYTQQGLNNSNAAFNQSSNYLQNAVNTGQSGTTEASNLLRSAPGVAGSATNLGQGSLLAGLGTQAGALNRLNQASSVVDPSNVSSFYNPFEQQVVDQTMTDVREGLAGGLNAQNASAVASGAFGGSRGRLLNEELTESAARGAAKQIGDIRSAGFNNAQNRQLQQAGLLASLGSQQSDIGARLGQTGVQQAGLGQNLAGTIGTTAGGLGTLSGNLANIYGGAARDMTNVGSQAGQLGLAGGAQYANLGQGLQNMQGMDINRLLGVGGMQQGLAQRGLDQQYGDFVGQYNLPLQTLGGIGGLAAQFAPQLGRTQISQTSATAPASNTAMQMLGTGLAAYGAFNGSGNTGIG
tara:strand:+ start:4815 stop:6137 length:1323 start_codon:yes stop_codon:yes gene_type:complete